jgi:site-specific recombinase XerD
MLHSFKIFLEDKYEQEKTINGYLNDLKLFDEYIEKENIKVAQIKETQIKRFLLFLAEKGYSNHSIARKLSALRLYFKHLRKEGIMLHNPMEDIKQPMTEKREVQLTDEEVKKMKELMRENERDFLLFLLVFDEKIKVSDVISIQVKDYQLQQGILYLMKRAISLSEETNHYLKTYIQNMQPEDMLMKNQKNKPLSESGAYFILKNYLKKINRNDVRPLDLSK